MAVGVLAKNIFSKLLGEIQGQNVKLKDSDAIPKLESILLGGKKTKMMQYVFGRMASFNSIVLSCWMKSTSSLPRIKRSCIVSLNGLP